MSESPSAVELNEKLYCFYQGTNYNGWLHQNVYDKGSWAGDQPVPHAGLSCSPSAVVYNYAISVVSQGRNNSGNVWYYSYDGESWDTPRMVPNAKMSGSPSTVAFNQLLFCFLRGDPNDGRLWYLMYDGSEWSTAFPITDDQIGSSPAAAVLNVGARQRLFCFYQGSGNQAGQLWYVEYDRSGWLPPQRLQAVTISPGSGVSVISCFGSTYTFYSQTFRQGPFADALLHYARPSPRPT